MNVCTVKPAIRRTDHINNIGTALVNMSAFVISDQDEGFCLVPKGGVGELCFGGAQVVSLHPPPGFSYRVIVHDLN